MESGLAPGLRRWAMLTVCMGTIVVAVDVSLPSVALPSIARHYAISASKAVLLVTVYQLVLVMSLLPVSAIGERAGYRTVYRLGLGCFIVGGVASYLAPSFELLLAARCIQALGTSATIAVTTALVRLIFPDHQLGRALAIHSVTVSSGNAFAPAVGGVIISALSWHAIFVAGIPLALVALAMSQILPPPVRRDLPYDWSSAGLCAAAFGCITAGLNQLGQAGPRGLALPLLTAGLIAAVIFVRRELEQAEPILPVDLIRQRLIALSIGGSFLAFNASMLITVTMPFRLTREFGFRAAEVGALMSPWPFMIMVGAPVAAMLSDRVKPSWLGAGGMAISFAGLVSLLFVPAAPNWWDIAWRMALSGLGFAFYTAPNARLVLQAAPRNRMASAGALTSTNRLTAQVIGATLGAGFLRFGPAGSSSAVAAAAALCLVAAICSVARFERRMPPPV